MSRLALLFARSGALLALVLSIDSAHALQLKNASVRFASAAEARAILQTNDDFIQRLSSFNRSAASQNDAPVSQRDFLRFVGESVREWTDGERKRLAIICSIINSRLRELSVSLPPQIVLVKTNGSEEWDGAYTRGTAIILPQHQLAHTTDLERLLCHELFHILSRHNRDMRERLYELIGFTKCGEVVLPPEIESRKIGNPDAPHDDHFIRVTANGKASVGVPILFSKSARYDQHLGRELRDYVEFRFLVAETADDLFHTDIDETRRKLVTLDEISGFFEQVGKNTNYVIHPEEILAENFALLVLAHRSVRSPELLEKMRGIIAQASHN